ncbi:MAG: uracil-DNA glycosylase [Methanotrichaceae archaeon]|nr:uracil-DNA glycosylase [Methanotrichaceae archaeon]
MNQADLSRLHQQIRACQLCPLCEGRNFAVPGSGPAPAEIMLVGEAPGREEDLKGLPFIGRAGKLLDGALGQAGLERSKVFITSVIKCRPPQNRKPKKAEIDQCRPYLQAQIDILHPKIICLMGNTAAMAILGKQGVTSLRGQILQDRFLVTYHPAAVLRNRNLMEEFVSDLKKAGLMQRHLHSELSRKG